MDALVQHQPFLGPPDGGMGVYNIGVTMVLSSDARRKRSGHVAMNVIVTDGAPHASEIWREMILVPPEGR